MTKPPPKKAGPVRHDTTQGMLNVVIAFRYGNPDQLELWEVARMFRGCILGFRELYDLDVAVTVVGAQGEASEHEEWPPASGNLTEDVPRHHTTRDKTTITPKDGLL